MKFAAFSLGTHISVVSSFFCNCFDIVQATHPYMYIRMRFFLALQGFPSCVDGNVTRTSFFACAFLDAISVLSLDIEVTSHLNCSLCTSLIPLINVHLRTLTVRLMDSTSLFRLFDSIPFFFFSSSTIHVSNSNRSAH